MGYTAFGGFPIRIEHPFQQANLIGGTSAATALNALPDGSPWKWVLCVTNLGSSHFVAFGDSTVSCTTTTRQAGYNRDTPVLLNIAGRTHFSTEGAGGGQLFLCPVTATRGVNSMLNTPPQISAVANIDTTAATLTAIPRNGTHPTKYVLIMQSSPTSLSMQFGYSTTAVGAPAPMFAITASSPLLLNCAGFTHISIPALATNIVTVAACGD